MAAVEPAGSSKEPLPPVMEGLRSENVVPAEETLQDAHDEPLQRIIDASRMDPSPAELVAKARAPVKKEFLVALGERVPISSDSSEASSVGANISNGTAPIALEGKNGAAHKISTVKKSKRQQKRERQEAKKSAENICNAVAKANDVNACPYGKGCRFNHDLEAFLLQKPLDLPGQCPFLGIRNPCPYGAACRFARTHQEVTNSMPKVLDGQSSSDELNTLRKDFQKCLWKNVASFPRADTQLLSMGLLGKAKQKAVDKLSTQESDTIKEPHDAPEEPEVENTASPIPVEDVKLSENGRTTEEMLGEENEEGEDARACKRSKPASANGTLQSEALTQAHETNAMYMDAAPTKGMEVRLSGDDTESKLNAREKKLVDFRGKLYVAPLTTVGNLPFRRVCKQLGADITCGEMAMCTNLLQGQASEWALLRRHQSEDVFGVQICGAHPDTVARTAEMIEKEAEIDFIDINLGCPIDLVVNKGAGSCLLTKPTRLQQIVRASSASIDIPLTIKVRTGYYEGRNCVHNFISDVYDWGATAVTIHGRTRQQRYSRLADWEYIYSTARLAGERLQVLGNGDIFSYTDWNEHMSAEKLSTCMLARGVLIKPWLLTEIKEQRHWDITSTERFDILKDYVRYGLQHWGSDSKGVETTRHFLLEWLSYTHRYIPVGLLEVVPQKLNWRPPLYYGRNDLETLMASDSAADWVRISEMLLGPAPAGFSFTPRHKSNAYDRAENG